MYGWNWTQSGRFPHGNPRQDRIKQQQKTSKDNQRKALRAPMIVGYPWIFLEMSKDSWYVQTWSPSQ